MSHKPRRYDLYLHHDSDSVSEESPGLGDADTEPSGPSTPRTPPHRSTKTREKPPRATQYDRHHKKGPPSMRTVESLSTIHGTEEPAHTREDVQEVYQELQDINDKLKREFKVLHQRDVVLKQKEKSLQDLQMSLETAIDNEVKRRLSSREQDHQLELRRIEDHTREKNKENRRLKENFEALKNANDILRKELDILTQSHEKLEKQYHSLQARFINLQRRKDPDDQKKDSLTQLGDVLPADLTHKLHMGLMTNKQKTTTKKTRASSSAGHEMLASLIDWICECQLRQSAADQPTKLVDNTTIQEQIEDRCFKMLPGMVDLVREQSSPTSRITLPCLQFVYWALVHIEASKSQHLKVSLTTTLRRLGDDLYRGRCTVTKAPDDVTVTSSEYQEKHRDTLFMKSNHLHTRILSSLVILKSITQVDHLAQVYEILRNDLKSDTGKEYYLYYQATPIMLTHLKPSNKALTNSALDIYLQMSMDTPYLRNFLDSCSKESWFQSVSLVWKMPGIEGKQHEKISIILQKLSKIRLNKRYFEVFGLTSSCQELHRSTATLSPFLSLNLKSILFNLSAAKPQAKSTS